LIYSTVGVITKVPGSLAPHAIKAIIDFYFAKHFREIEVVNFGARNGKADETIGKILMLGNQSIPMKIIRKAGKNPQPIEIEATSILLFDSPENFKQNKISFATLFENKPQLVYFPGARFDNVRTFPKSRFSTSKTMFLVNETKFFINLATVDYFSHPKNCEANQWKTINRYRKLQRKWDNSKFVVEKFDNFNNCSLKVTNTSYKYFKWGYDELSKELNFSIDIQTNNLFMKNNELYLEFRHFPYMESMFAHALPLAMEQRTIYIPPGELYGDYEKMLLPFDTASWVAIVLLIVFTISSILAVKLKPVEIQRVIFGKNISSPLMNFISIILNGSQNGTMIENSPRICLAVFLFWSLIIR
jgi:hypothetical protein